MIVFILLLILVDISSTLHTKIYDYSKSPYLLTKEDYLYNKYIIVEMWSAGGGGSDYNPDNLSYSYTGGGSGAYVKAFIKTKLSNFNIIVGNGGQKGQAYYTYVNDKINFIESISGYSGNYTSFSSSNGEINIIVMGGESGNIGGNGGYLSSITGIDKYNTIPGKSSNFCNQQNKYISCGGNAPLGGNGSTNYNWVNLHDIYYLYFGYDGKIPGGGGVGYYIPSSSYNYLNHTSMAGNGANGLVIVYFDDNNAIISQANMIYFIYTYYCIMMILIMICH